LLLAAFDGLFAPVEKACSSIFSLILEKTSSVGSLVSLQRALNLLKIRAIHTFVAAIQDTQMTGENLIADALVAKNDGLKSLDLCCLPSFFLCALL